jgi:hypothetical protein
MAKATLMYEAGLFPGDDQQFNRKWQGQAATYAEPISADGQYVTGPCFLVGIIITATTATDVINFHDGTSNSGAKKYVLPSGTAVHTGNQWLQCAIPFNSGLYIDFVGTGTIVPLVIAS